MPKSNQKKNKQMTVREAISSHEITLQSPIIIEGMEKVETIYLRKPDSGSLRGLNFMDLMQGDFTAVNTLVPRISNINDRQMLNVDPADLAQIIPVVMGFFVNIDSQTE